MRNKYQSSCEHSEAFFVDRHQNPLHAILAGFQRPEGRDAGILVGSGSKIHLQYVNKVKTEYEYLKNVNKNVQGVQLLNSPAAFIFHIDDVFEEEIDYVQEKLKGLEGNK